MKRKLSPPPLRPSSKLGVPDYSSSESLRAQCGEDVVGRRKSGPTVLLLLLLLLLLFSHIN